MSERNFVSTLQAVLGMLQCRTVIPQGVLQDVRSFSASLCQLLEAYNWRFSNTTVATLDRLRLTLILKVRCDIEARTVTPDQESKGQAPRPATARADRAISEKKIIANRQNSHHSTGPRSREGRKAVAQNALKHGLLGEIIIMPGEKSNEFESLEAKLRGVIRPRGLVAEQLVHNAAVLVWKLGRCISIQGSPLSTPEPDDRWRTLHRYAGSLSRQLREVFCDLYVLRNEKERAMSDEKRKWNLLTDGVLWKAAASATDDPELQKRSEIVVGWFQENLDRTDGLLLLIADSVAAAFVRKQQVLTYESAHARIAAFNSRERVEKADPSIRESACAAAAFPADDVLDRIIKYQSLCDRQIHKFMELLGRLWKRAEEHASDVSRKPPQKIRGGEGGEPGAESTGTDGSHVTRTES